jgi:hypothetical protein
LVLVATGGVDIRELIRRLNSLQHGERASAMLVACGPRAIPPLREFLLEGKPSTVFQPRRWAVEALAGLGATDVLMEYLGREARLEDPAVRLGEEAVESAAARLLGQWRSEGAYDFLLELSERRMLTGLIEALAEFGRAEAIPYFDRALEDDFYRPAAEEALRKMGAAARAALALSAATPLPDIEEESPSSLRRRRSVLRLLVEMGVAPEDWPTLGGLLEESDAEIVTAAARLAAAAAGPEDRVRAAERVVEVLPEAEWYLQDEVELALVELAPQSRGAVEREIAKRLASPGPARAMDSALRTLLRTQRRL